MFIRDVFYHIAIVSKGIGLVSWNNWIFKGILGFVCIIGIGPGFLNPYSVVVVNGEGPLLRTNEVPQLFPHRREPMPHSPNVPYNIRSCPFLFYLFLLICLLLLFDYLKVNKLETIVGQLC
ncbi:hypothetical protein RF11_10020 [Thelohanellus kitauei]|uniref:Uncharacterized protein n=1 Tax=Thelohanellus kitauei TaxID=669202 RepID=A0A0C2IYG1_THEKT|nr:hypothetical protein RF11_10020 [Thelohanellus kitauei]